MNIEERRKNPRFPFNSKGELHMNRIAYRGKLIDFSQHGALFESGIHHIGIANGVRCSLDILQLNEKTLCTIDGEIMYCRNNLIGIQFIDIDQERLARLLDAGALNLAPAKLFNRKMAALLQNVSPSFTSAST